MIEPYLQNDSIFSDPVEEFLVISVLFLNFHCFHCLVFFTCEDWNECHCIILPWSIV